MTRTDDVNEEPAFETLLRLLDDDYAREILAETSREPMTVPELSENSEASPPTLYRRVEELKRAGLVRERTRPRQDGHHDTVYAATLTRLLVTLDDGVFEFELDRADEDAVDRLQRLWSEF